MRTSFFDFEEPILGIKQRIQELESFPATEGVDFSAEIANLHAREEDLLREIYAGLNPWQIVQVARHPLRPYFLDYVRLVCDEFIELHGDRLYGDDKAIVGGFASIGGVRVVILGQQKGRGCVKESIARNFGMAKPEGYRKALRLMKLAEKFKLPIVTIIDTPGAYPGIDAEERGQSEAIARNLREMSLLATPILSIVIGEGGSGGALGIGVCDRLLMLQNSMYSVISPEGCASILWHDATKAEDAAKALDMGFLIGVTGIVGYKKNTDLRETFKKVGLKYLMVETDCPYLPPQSLRGKRNEPSFIPQIAADLAVALGEPLGRVADITTQNCRDLFKI